MEVYYYIDFQDMVSNILQYGFQISSQRYLPTAAAADAATITIAVATITHMYATQFSTFPKVHAMSKYLQPRYFCKSSY